MRPSADLAVLPKPRKVAFGSGSVRASSLRTVATQGRVPRSLAKHVHEFASRNGLQTASPDRASILVGLNPAESRPHPEGYVLRIDNQTVLSAHDAPGLFYGLQTLQQLLDTTKLLRRCTIEDWPALSVRGFYFDLTRQAPTAQFLKTIVDRLAAAKINTLMIQYREFFPYEGFPLIVSRSSYTKREVTEFVRYASDRYIQVVPLLQSLSFREYILRGQAYAYLRERPHEICGICPTHPDSFRLYCALAEQLIAAHPAAQYFHIAGDEANTVGECDRCKAAMKHGSKAKLVSGFLNKIIRFLLDRGVKPMMWGDMLFGHLEERRAASQYARDMLSELSGDIVAADWDYWSTGPDTPPAEHSPYAGIAGLGHVERLVDAGFSVIGAPSCSSGSNAGRNAIDHVHAFANITAFAKELKRRECLGMVTTFWPTNANAEVRWCRHPWGAEVVDVCYQQVRPGLEAHWYNIWRGAECAWSAAPRSRKDYDRAFARAHLGTDDTSYPDGLNLASFSVGRRPGYYLSANAKQARLRKGMEAMRKALRAARRAKPTVAYSELFLRVQQHSLRWEEFHSRIPHMAAAKLSREQLRQLRTLMAERRTLEREFRRTYVTMYNNVHLEEEVQHRFAEEQRLQEQLL